MRIGDGRPPRVWAGVSGGREPHPSILRGRFRTVVALNQPIIGLAQWFM
jgi:hypothetical protein